MSTGVFPGGKGGRCVNLTTLPPTCAVDMKSGNLNFLEPCGPLQACNGTALPQPTLYSCRPTYGKCSTSNVHRLPVQPTGNAVPAMCTDCPSNLREMQNQQCAQTVRRPFVSVGKIDTGKTAPFCGGVNEITFMRVPLNPLTV
jgi:hypothetical protein